MKSAILAVVALLAWVGPAFAQPSPSIDLASEADLHFRLGVERYQKLDYRGALEHLLVSNRLAENRKVLFNIARCYEAMGEPALAWRHYTDFLQEAQPSEARDQAEEAVNRLTAQVALIRLVTDPPGASIFVDRRDLGSVGSTPRTLAVTPGEHLVLLELPMHEVAEARAKARLAETGEVNVVLKPVLGEVVVTGTPTGALLIIGDEEVGRLPATLHLPLGQHAITVEAPDHESIRRLVLVSDKESAALRVELDARVGTIVVPESLVGALIEVGGQPAGFAPLVLEMPVGAYDLVVSADGYRPAELQVEVTADTSTEVDVVLESLREVTAASRIKEALIDAPATMVVLTAEDIHARGYTDLTELIADLPGFDMIVTNGTTQITAYQRGFRTPSTQRTLLLIDGKVDNLLWSQAAEISRQYPISNIERVEVLYGPASAIYGPNAFLGIINIITADAVDLGPGEQAARVDLHLGSYRTRAVDATARGRLGELGYSVTGRVFQSDEPDFSDAWVFTDAGDYGNRDYWGTILDLDHKNVPLGEYSDPTDDMAVMGRLHVRGFEIGGHSWTTREGFGPYYASDRAQPGVQWNLRSERIYGSHSGRLFEGFTARSTFVYRTSRIWGAWAEASPTDIHSDISNVSYTNWNAINHSWYFRELVEYQLSEHLAVSGGMKLERKEMSRSYDVPGYWEGSFSSMPVEPESAIVDSRSDLPYELPPAPNVEMPPQNLVMTDDIGGFGQAIFDVAPFRFNAGLRFDYNSEYLGVLNPRCSAIYKFGEDRAAIKVLYGEAFQEPAPRQLWGGWDGRAANEDLEPEKARNVEVVGMVQSRDVLSGLSVFYADYDNVIKEEAENAGSRSVFGIEVRNRTKWTNLADLSTWFYYTYNHAVSSITYNHNREKWVEAPGTVLGDIAPHKVNLGADLPLPDPLALHLSGNWVSARKLYPRNPLRAQGLPLPPYFLLNGTIQANFDHLDLGVKVRNVLGADYVHPGVESASAGNDRSGRSLGYHNSVLPQAGRSVLGTVRVEF